MTARCLSVVLVNAVVKVFLKSVQRISWSRVKPPAGDSLLQSSSIWACTQSSTLGPLIRDKAKLTRRYRLWNISLFSFMFQRMSNSHRKVLVLVLSPSNLSGIMPLSPLLSRAGAGAVAPVGACCGAACGWTLAIGECIRITGSWVCWITGCNGVVDSG